MAEEEAEEEEEDECGWVMWSDVGGSEALSCSMR